MSKIFGSGGKESLFIILMIIEDVAHDGWIGGIVGIEVN